MPKTKTETKSKAHPSGMTWEQRSAARKALYKKFAVEKKAAREKGLTLDWYDYKKQHGVP